MKKLSLFIYSLAGGGAERVVSLLLQELPREFNLTLVLMNTTLEYPVPENIEVKYLEKSKASENGIFKLLKIPFLAYRYKQLCQKERIDISLSFMNRPNYINVIAKLLGMKSKVIISERAMPSLQYGYKNAQSFINKTLIGCLYPRAESIIANSQGNARDLNVNFNISKEQIEVVYNPIDIQSVEMAGEETTEVSFSRFTFVTVGRLDRGKNHKMLIDAFKALDTTNAQLLIIGDGPLKDDLLKQIDRLNLNEKVFLLGKQTNPYKFLDKSDCFVFGSNHEGFPNVILEALASGLPVVSTDCQSGPREILAPNMDNEFGLLVPINDVDQMSRAMQRIMQGQDLSNQYKKKARIRARDFDKEKIIKNYIRIINE